ncbi:MAG TPA: polysaccharide biosynthesis tyrosine autokinase, partial [Pyrinomonadaceae bacterium]|nr:polysaccharide biosynthesis tyrosine autokinase [Pyrinomonadaceae bacterium]
ELLLKRIAELQTEVRSGEERLINYAKNNQILSLDPSQNTVVERLAGLNRQLLEAENERKMAEASYRAALRPGAADALAEENARQISETEMKLAELRQKRANLLVENTEEWPEVKEVAGQITSLEAQLKNIRERASSTILTNMQTRFNQAAAREQSLRDAFNSQRAETLTQNEAAINYRIIQQEIETNKQLLDSMLQGSKQNDMMLAETPNNAYVVDYAIAPSQAVGPRRLLTITLALMLSLGVGVGLAFFMEYFDNSIRSVDDIERTLRLPALAVIPSLGAIKKRKLLGSDKPAAVTTSLALRETGNGNGNGNGNGKGGSYTNPELWIHLNNRSPISEAYRQLRTSVLLSSAGRAPRTILVTSSTPAEGKTTTAVNTAISLAQTGESVVIIDADMRRPRLHSIFNLPNTKGLSHILSKDTGEAEMLGSVETESSSGLHVIPAGMAPPNPAELLGSHQMRRLIVTLESKFKYVVIDSPPVASFTDGVLLSTMADGVLLVVHGGKTSREIAKRARQHLQDVGARIFGVVLNRVDTHSADYYDYYHTYHADGYYEAAEETVNT